MLFRFTHLFTFTKLINIKLCGITIYLNSWTKPCKYFLNIIPENPIFSVQVVYKKQNDLMNIE